MSFNVKIDLYVIADHSSTLGYPKVLAIDGEAGMCAHHFPRLSSISGAFEFKGQVNIFGNSLDRERAMGHVIIALLFHRLALEGDLRKLLGIKETGGAEIVVARSVVSIDTRRLDGHVHGRFGDVLARQKGSFPQTR